MLHASEKLPNFPHTYKRSVSAPASELYFYSHTCNIFTKTSCFCMALNLLTTKSITVLHLSHRLFDLGSISVGFFESSCASSSIWVIRPLLHKPKINVKMGFFATLIMYLQRRKLFEDSFPKLKYQSNPECNHLQSYRILLLQVSGAGVHKFPQTLLWLAPKNVQETNKNKQKIQTINFTWVSLLSNWSLASLTISLQVSQMLVVSSGYVLWSHTVWMQCFVAWQSPAFLIKNNNSLWNWKLTNKRIHLR